MQPRVPLLALPVLRWDLGECPVRAGSSCEGGLDANPDGAKFGIGPCGQWFYWAKDVVPCGWRSAAAEAVTVRPGDWPAADGIELTHRLPGISGEDQIDRRCWARRWVFSSTRTDVPSSCSLASSSAGEARCCCESLWLRAPLLRGLVGRGQADGQSLVQGQGLAWAGERHSGLIGIRGATDGPAASIRRKGMPKLRIVYRSRKKASFQSGLESLLRMRLLRLCALQGGKGGFARESHGGHQGDHPSAY